MTRYCLICGKEKNGIPIKEDKVIKAIRFIKRTITKNKKRNIVVICKDDYDAYKLKRKKFESRQRLYIVLGLLFAVIGVVLNPRLSTVIFSVFIMVLLYGLSLLSYMPLLDVTNPNKKVK